jgi:thiol-disulfide isomerase/thioredoxin
MTKYTFPIFLLVLINFTAFGQTSHGFTIIGESNFFDQKELILAPAVFTPTNEFNDSKIPISTFKITDKRFKIDGNYLYPVPLQFSYLVKAGDKFKARMSDLLFIDNDTIQILLDDFNNINHFGNNLKSTSNTEYNNIKKLYKDFEVFNGSRYIAEGNNILKKDIVLSNYVKGSPESVVAMWILIYDYQLYGYSVKKNEIADLFSNTIKEIPAFQALINKMNADKSLAIGKSFPIAEFGFAKEFGQTIENSKYTLIDFWASYCKPCINQFPDLKMLYEKYKSKGFQIYTISIDRRDRIASAKKILKNQKVGWENSFDIDGKKSLVFNIVGIPRSFLVDSRGDIIESDMSIRNLEKFLKANAQ